MSRVNVGWGEGRGEGSSHVSNLRLLGCFLLVYFGGVLLVVVVLVVTTKQSKAKAWTLDWSLTISLQRPVNGELGRSVYRTYGIYPSVDWSTVNGKNTSL